MAPNAPTEPRRARGMRVRGRLVLLLAIPLVALVGITGYGVAYGTTRSLEAGRLQDRSDLGMLAHALVDALQQERGALIADGATTPELRESIRSTTAELTARAESIGGETRRGTEIATRRLAALDRIAAADLGGRVALRHYSLAVQSLLDLAGDAAAPRGAIDDAAASTVDYLARARAASSEEHDVLRFFTAGGTLDANVFQQLTALGAAQESYNSLAAVAATDPDLTIRIERVGHSMRAADSIRRDAFVALGSGRAEEWRAGLEERTRELGALQDEASVLADSAVNDLARWSRLLLMSAALSAIAIVLVSALLLRRALRTIARPLQDLAIQAEDVAQNRLPAAVRAQQGQGSEELHLPALRVTGAAEVHEVASAFNDIQDTALRLAGEQAALRLNQSEAMTNLGRRNQTLLARQLDFISSLETRETDPVFLEHLFKLDHLASRMRRNAESLLILAGSETPRRRRTPAPVTEVVRAAMSEVEEFERVRIGHLRDATVSGPAVIDLVHLLAELIENALGFSPPESTVEIDGRSLGQGGYQFAVIDHGVGMSDLELVAANQRMSGSDELEGMPTRYLGQYVVAKLASKIGAMVHVQPSSGGRGVTAIVNLPGGAMLGSPDRSAVAHPLPGSRKAREQGPVPFAPGAGVSELARVAAEPAPQEYVPHEPEPVGSEAEWPVTTWEGPEVSPQMAELPPVVQSAGHDVVAQDVTGLGQHAFAETGDDIFPEADRDTFTDEVGAFGVTAPPPAPPEVPAQPDWVPQPQRELEPVTDGGDEDPEGASAEPVPATEQHAESSSAGGLVRRVPGASLAERQGVTRAAEATPVPERSATEVKSMLSSFQAGRSRGLGDAGFAEPDASDEPAENASPEEDEQMEDPMDWRSAT